ncbi:PilZ domain-containing protein [Hyalangium rubrum]|uniref:PilZ domain-containing protein n=1 Tax=Hyalangium rubrum TaxID=3103134 RepID=A0ABU5GVM6_9BACT|nr:PilZ domain-containing protein [Hyalangium sp. s54d21]MDY7225225.1 PilZ domain-containing protein [Hyalangium sp. s54d21]
MNRASSGTGFFPSAAEVTMQSKGARKGKAPSREADTSAPAAKPEKPEAIAAPTSPLAAKGADKPSLPRVSFPRPEERRPSGRGEEAGRPGASGRRGGAPMLAPIIETRVGDEPEHRHFPRARLATRFELWREEGGTRTFAASFTSLNVSVSGAFLESTFFMPMGTELNVRFALEEGAEPVQARAQIVREERNGPDGRSGFGIRFVEFSGQTEVSLARLFLGMRLRTFVEDYLQSRRSRSLPNELERAVDVLAAWELLKATSPGDPWRGE